MTCMICCMSNPCIEDRPLFDVFQPVEAGDEAFWSQFWSESATCVQDVFTLIPAAEIRALREESPSNLATLCYKAVEKLVQVAEAGCRSQKDEQMGKMSSSWNALVLDTFIFISFLFKKIKL